MRAIGEENHLGQGLDQLEIKKEQNLVRNNEINQEEHLSKQSNDPSKMKNMILFAREGCFDQDLDKTEHEIEKKSAEDKITAEEAQEYQIFCMGDINDLGDLLTSEPEKEEDVFLIDVSDLREKKDKN